MRAERSRPAGVDGGKSPAAIPKPAPASNVGDFDGALSPTAQKLQGEWAPLELIISGTPMQAAYLTFGLRTHAGVEAKVVFGGQTMVHAKVRFNEAATPIEVGYLNLSGKGKGSLSLGLFRWDGGESVFCIGAPGSPWPADFSCEKGSGRTLSRWRRKS